MLKNNPVFLIQSVGMMFERDATGWIDRTELREKQIARAIELREENQKIISKIVGFQTEIKEELTSYLCLRFPQAEHIIIDGNSITIDVRDGEKFSAKDIKKIESLTNHTLDKVSKHNRFIFTKKPSLSLVIHEYPEELEKVKNYIKYGNND